MDQVQRGLSPTPPARLSDIYGPGTFLASRPWEGASHWLTLAGPHVEAMTGRHAAFAGEMPDLCHVSTRTPAILQLMRDAGLRPSEHAVLYRTRQEYLDRAKSLVAQGLRHVTVYRVPEEVLPAGAAVVDPELVGYLNNKANVAKLAPEEGVARREVMSGAEFAARQWRLPIVVKIATDEANAGGRDVAPCLRPRHLERAKRRFAEAESVVVESFIDIARNDSFQIAVLPDRSVTAYPPTLQIANYKGVHTSNVHDASDPPPAAAQALALAAAQKGAERGYRGICGFDVLTDKAGKSFIVDLNFRICASTGMVLLTPELVAARKLPVVQQVTAYWHGSIDAFARAVSAFVAAGSVAPIGIFDAQAAGMGGRSEMTLLLFGRERREIELLLRRLAALGVSIKGWQPPLWQQAGDGLRRMFAR